MPAQINYQKLPQKKANSIEEARNFIKSAQDNGYKIVIVTGCFDLLHRAHIMFLKNSKQIGELLVVGLEDDNRVKAFKGVLRPLATIQQRCEVMSAVAYVDFVFVVEGEETKNLNRYYSKLHKQLGADYLAVSENDPALEARRKQFESSGGKIRIIKKYEGISTDSLIRKYLEGHSFEEVLEKFEVEKKVTSMDNPYIRRHNEEIQKSLFPEDNETENS